MWILVIALLTGRGVAVTTVEMKTEAACTAAAAKAEIDLSPQSAFGPVVKTTCIAKGTP